MLDMTTMAATAIGCGGLAVAIAIALILLTWRDRS